MTPGMTLVGSVNRALTDPMIRETVRRLHAEGTTLVDMVGALGLADELPDHIRDTLNNLAPDIVEAIRTATLAMLDNSTDQYQMPIDCHADQADIDAGRPLDVTVAAAPQPTIQVNLANG